MDDFKLFIAAIALVSAAAASARSPFDLTVNVGGSYEPDRDLITGGTATAARGFTSIKDLFDALNSADLNGINSSYNDSAAAVLRIGYRGLPVVVETQDASPMVTLRIPAIGELRSFDARAVRDGNWDDMEDYLKKSRDGILDRLQKALVRVSPVDPLAGNPTSIQSQMAFADFDRGFTQQATGLKGEGTTALGLRFGTYSMGGLTSRIATLPISHAWDLAGGRQQFIVSLPISYGDVGGAKSYSVNPGVAYQFAVNDAWSLTPALGYGISGAIDLGSAASMVSASLTSKYTVDWGDYRVSIGNMAGVYQSAKLKHRDYSSNPDIRNTILRNGVLVGMPTPWRGLGHALTVEGSYVLTTFSGDALYSRLYHEIGITLGTDPRSADASSAVRAGLTYMRGQNGIRGLSLNFGYWF